MQLEHSFTVPVGIDDAWKVLLDIERVAPCMPGAALETVHGDDFTGTVKVKLGPIALTYKGKASFVEKDELAHRAKIHAQGRDARGNGTASAKVTASLSDEGGQTKVEVLTDLDITGKPAQFGRGVMVDVGNKLIGQFADCLAGKLSGAAADTPPSDGSDDAASAEPEATATAAKKAAAKSAAPAKKADPAPAKKAAPAKKTAAASPAPPASAAVGEAAEPPSVNGAGEASAEPPSVNGAGEPALTSEAAPVPRAPAEPAPTAGGPRQIAPTEVEPIDLLEHAGPAVAKRLAPVAALVVLLMIILRLRRRPS